MIPPLPASFLARPITHRGFHDLAEGRPENSRAAIRAAIEHGFGIEIDVQLSADGQAMSFHDYTLDRLTETDGPVAERRASDLSALKLKGGDEGIPTLDDILDEVRGRVPLVIEIKDQDGALGEDVGLLERAVSDAIDGYEGPIAVMSFNPHSIAAMQTLRPDVPRGLVTEAFQAGTWPVPEARLAELREIPDFDRVGAAFISHDVKDLTSPHVARLKARGVPILCWTVRSPEVEAEARRIADNVTFERYLPG